MLSSLPFCRSRYDWKIVIRIYPPTCDPPSSPWPGLSTILRVSPQLKSKRWSGRSLILACGPENLDSRLSFCYQPRTSYESPESRWRSRENLWKNSIRYVFRIVGRSPPSSFHTVFVKVYLAVDAQDTKFLNLFGNFCSANRQLPASAVLSVGLVKHDDVPFASGGLTDVWRGDHMGAPVAMKAFGASQNLEEVEEVRIQCARSLSL